MGGRYIATPNADPIFAYQNAPIAIDVARGINNGEPSLHAAWLGAIAPQPGECAIQIGTGGGYYTAILAMLVLPKGRVIGLEIDPALQLQSRKNLTPFENASVSVADAVTMELPQVDIIYVNAGVVAPPLHWLQALKPGGRIIFPWRPAHNIGLAVLATRTNQGFTARTAGGAWFIACAGASDESISIKKPDPSTVRSLRSIVLTKDREPDETALAVYSDIWFSNA